jgi:hypothetical protein
MKVVWNRKIQATVLHNQTSGPQMTECGHRSLVGSTALPCVQVDACKGGPPTRLKTLDIVRSAMLPGAASPHAPRPPVLGNLFVGAGCSESCTSGARARVWG